MNLQKHEIDAIADLTVRLTKMRQDNCAHLSVENVAPEIFGRLVMAYKGEATSGTEPGPIIFEPGSPQAVLTVRRYCPSVQWNLHGTTVFCGRNAVLRDDPTAGNAVSH